ncbi:MAG TPA: redoxin domain-containing protein [Chitinophagales bacterium]|nr:redoxin domain-containing protein [Chitinophagales bacterium]
MKTSPRFISILKASLSMLIVITLIQAQVKDSSDPNQLINHPMPAISGTTINGEPIDASFFKDNVVVIAFGNLSDVSSLKEIEYLNQLGHDFQGHPFKVLAVMPNTKQDVKDFNDVSATNNTESHQMRMTLQLPVMEYPVMATCDKRNADKSLQPACDNVVKDFLISDYPLICVVDKTGTVRYVHLGLPAQDQQQDWRNLIATQITSVLKGL